MKDYRNIPITQDDYFQFMKDYFENNPPRPVKEEWALKRLKKALIQDFPDKDTKDLENTIKALKERGLPYTIQWYYYEIFLVIGKKTRGDFETFSTFNRYFEFMDILFHLEQMSGLDWYDFPIDIKRFFMAIRKERKMLT